MSDEEVPSVLEDVAGVAKLSKTARRLVDLALTVPSEKIATMYLIQMGYTLTMEAVRMTNSLDEDYTGGYREAMSVMFDFSVYGYTTQDKAVLNAFVSGSLGVSGLLRRFTVRFQESADGAHCTMTVAERHDRGDPEAEEGSDDEETAGVDEPVDVASVLAVAAPVSPASEQRHPAVEEWELGAFTHRSADSHSV